MKRYSVLILIIAFVLCCVGLGAKSLWLDECYSLLRSSLYPEWGKTIETIAKYDAHPPAYYLTLKIWTSIQLVNNDEIWVRLPSITFFLITLIILYYLLADFSHSQILLLALASCSCLSIQYAQEARHYTLSMVLATCATYCFVQFLQQPEQRFKFLCIYTIAAVLALYTYYYLIFLFIAHGLIVVFLGYQRKKFDLLVPWLRTQVCTAILFFPWAYWVLPNKFALFDGANPNLKEQAAFSLASLWQLIGHFLVGESLWLYKDYFVAVIVVLFIVQLYKWYLERQDNEQSILVISSVCFLVPIVIVAIFPFKGHIFQSKHLLFLLPLLWVIISLTVRLKNKWTLILPALIILGNIISLCNYYPQQKQAWQEACHYIHSHLQKDDVVVFNPFYLRPPFTRYYAVEDQFIAGQYDIQSRSIKLYPGKKLKKKNLWRHLRIQRNHFWVVEVENSPVAPPDFRVHKWCKRFYRLEGQKTFMGLYGNIVVSRYIPR